MSATKTHKVDSDPGARWLTIGVATQTRDEKGHIKTIRQTVIEAWQVSDRDYRAVIAHLGEPAHVQAEVEPAPAPDASNTSIPPELANAIEAFKAGRLDETVLLAARTPAVPRRRIENQAYVLAVQAREGFLQDTPGHLPIKMVPERFRAA